MLAFVVRIIYGGINENQTVKEITGETIMEGSFVGYVMIGIIIISLFHVIFNGLSQKN